MKPLLAILFATALALPSFADPARDQRIITAVESLEQSFRSAKSLADTVPAAASLLAVIEREAAPTVAARHFAGFAAYYESRSGLNGYLALVRAVPSARAETFRAALAPGRRAQFEQVERGTNPALDEKSLAWFAQTRRPEKPQLAGHFIDLRPARLRALLHGDAGALLDLAYAAYYGSDTPQDADVNELWATVARIHAPLVFQRATAASGNDIGILRPQAEAGCGWAMTILAQKLLPDERGPIPPGEALDLLRRAASLGYAAATQYIDWRGLAATQPTVAVTPAPAPIAVPATPATIVDKHAAALAALAKFEAAVVACTSPEQIGAPAAALIAALDAHGDKPLADAANTAARHLIFHLGGARGYHAFLMGLPETRFSEAMKHLQQNGSEVQKNVVRRLNDEDQNARFNRPVTAVDTSAWPAGKRGDRGPKKNDVLDLPAIYRNLLAGARGALIDLVQAFDSGDGAPLDTILTFIWGDIAQQLVPDSMKDSWEDQQWLASTAARGSGLAEYWLAQDQQKTATAADLPAIRARYERALQRGVKAAQRQLALLDNQGKPATAVDWLAAATEVNALRARTEAERLRQPASPRPAGSSTQNSSVSDEEMGLGPEALARSRAELRALGLNDAAIDAYDKDSAQRMASTMAEVRASGLSDQQIAEGLNQGMTALFKSTGPVFTTKLRLGSPAPGVELLQLTGFDGDLRAVRYFDGAYHAVSDKGVALRSVDGRAWTQLFAPASGSFDDICGGDGRLLIVPPVTVRISTQGKAPGWLSLDHGKTWQPAATGLEKEIGFAAGKFWRVWAGENAAYESTTDLKSWQRHDGIPAELLAKAPTLRLGHVQLFAGRVYRYPIYNVTSQGGAKIESSADLKTWRLEFRLPTAPGTATTPIQFNVEGDTLALGAVSPFGQGKVQYHLLSRGQSWRSVFSDHSALGGMASQGGWTVMHSSAAIGGFADVTRGFSLIRFLGDLSGYSSQFAAGSAGFVFGGPQGHIAILTPHPRWSLRPAHEPLAEARAAQLKGNYDLMQRLIDEARKDAPLAPDAWVLEARAAFERNQPDWLKSAVAAGLEKHPKNTTLLGLRAYYRVSTKDTAGAKQDADAALAIAATQPEAALTRFMLTQGQDSAALDAALALDRHFVTGFVTRAALRNAKGDRAGMLADLAAAEASRPDHADFQLTLAGMYLQLGLAEDARRCTLRARDLGHPRAGEALKLVPAK